MDAQSIAFRVDGSFQAGTGHFMRCLTLADGLKQSGARTRFISRHLPEHLRDMLAVKGHEFRLLKSVSDNTGSEELAHSAWLGVSQKQDAEDTTQALSDITWSWLVVDHYALDARWESSLRQSAENIMVIDDLADRYHDCDILLDQNLYLDMDYRYKEKTPRNCLLLLGPRYVLLREEFQRLSRNVKVRKGDVERLLVLFGGIDADNFTGKVVDVLINLEYQFKSVDVVVGAQHPFREQIAAACAMRGYTFHQQTNRIAELMATSDLAIGACGFTCYEFAAMRLPSIVIPVTEIQKTVAKLLSEKGVTHALIFQGKDIAEKLTVSINKILASNFLREAMSLACQDFLDTDGVSRVVAKILTSRDMT